MKSKVSISILSALLLAAFLSPLSAEMFFSANDLDPASLTANLSVESFTILANSRKGVTIETIPETRVASDGEVFNNRIKLNGGGAADYRAIRFKADGKTECSIYLNSSSGTDARILKLCDSSGAVLAELTAPPDDKVNAGIVVFTLPLEGEYLVYSANSGINIYQIVIK